MSASDNSLHFVGMVANTPLARPAKNGIFLTFMVQIVERWQGRDGSWKEEVTDVDLAIFGDQARELEASLKVGMWVDVEGKLQTQRGNRKSDGKPYAILKVKPTRLEIVKGGKTPTPQAPIPDMLPDAVPVTQPARDSARPSTPAAPDVDDAALPF